MPNNPLTEQELYDYGILRSLTPPAEVVGRLSPPYFPAGYFLIPPHDVNGPVLWRKFHAGYIQEGIIDPERLGTGYVGDGNLYLADDGTWKEVSGGDEYSHLYELNDVSIVSVQNNQLLRYNSTTSKWENWTPNFLTTVPTLDQVTTAGNTSSNPIAIGTTSIPNLSLDTKLYLQGSGSGTSGRTAFAVKNTNSSSAAAFRLYNSNDDFIAFQVSGPSYAVPSEAGVSVNDAIDLSFVAGGNVASGATNKIGFRTGGYAQDFAMTILGNKNVLIGTTTDSGYKLDVNGTARIVNNLTVSGGLDVVGQATVKNYGSSTFIVQETQNNFAVWIKPQWYQFDTSMYFNSEAFSIKYNTSVGGFNQGHIINMRNNGNVMIGGTQDNGFKLEVSGTFRSTGAVQVATSTGGLGVGTTSPGYKLDVNGNGRFVGDLFANAALTVGGLLTSPAGKIGVQGNVDGGNSRGIFLWNINDSNWGIYMARAGVGKSLSGGTAPASLDGRTGQAVRFRAYYDINSSFIWESNNSFGLPNNYAIMSLATTTGNLTTRGSVTSSSFVKTGGTNSQFLKADGSVDSNLYLTSFTEIDPTVPSYVKAITSTQITNWDTAYSWGNHASAGYLTSYTETDTLATVTARGNTTNTAVNIQNYLNLTSAITVSGSTGLSLGYINGSYGFIQSFSSRPLTINPLGNNVLIGTTIDSGFKLDITGTFRATGNVLIEGNTDINGLFRAFGPVVMTDTPEIPTNILLYQDPDSSQIYRGTIPGNQGNLFFNNTFGIGANSNLYWNNSNQRLGIGTNSPSQKLHVVGTVLATELSITDGSTTGLIKYAGLNGSASSMDLVMPNSGSIRFGAVNFDGPAFQGFHATRTGFAGQMYFDYGSQQRVVAERGAFFRNASSTSPVTVMKLTAASNVLIGTTTDNGVNRLQVNGDAQINGVIVGLGGGSVTTNTLVGANSFVANTTGTYNTVVGYNLALGTSTGNNSILLGANSFLGSQTLERVIAITNNSFLDTATTVGTDNIFIGHGITNTGQSIGSNNIMLGHNQASLGAYGSNSIAIGNNLGGGNLGNLKDSIIIGHGSTGRAYAEAGIAIGNSITVWAGSVGIGGSASSGASVVIGYNSSASGEGSIAIGRYSRALSNNIQIGYNSGRFQGNSTENVAIGNGTLYANSGSGHTAVGNLALGSSGVNGNNTAIGKQSLRYTSSGSTNTALGSESGLNNSTGSGNVFIGYQAGRDATTDSNKLYIANSVTNTLIYGDFSTGNISIGSTVDDGINKLQVTGNVIATSFIKSGGTASQFLKADGSIDNNIYQTTAGSVATWTTARTFTIGNTGKLVNGSADVSWTTTEIGAERQIPVNTIYNYLTAPTVREIAVNHKTLTNKFRFIAPTSQEESVDGVTWNPSSRATAAQLGDLMRGDGEGTSFIAIPGGTVGTYGGYRLTWNVLSQTDYVILTQLYLYHETKSNNVSVLIERFSGGTWSVVTGPHNVSNWPGHSTIPHTAIAYSIYNAAHATQVRITFSTNRTNSNEYRLENIEWYGTYGIIPTTTRRNVESYDRDKNATFPAGLRANNLLLNTTTPSGYLLDVNGSGRVLGKLQVTGGSINASTVNANANDANNYVNQGISKIYSTNNALYIGVSSVVNDRRTWIQSGHESTAYANSTGTISLNPLGGNVGIGIMTPTSKLHVAGEIKSAVAANNFGFQIENTNEPSFKYRIYNHGSTVVTNVMTTGLFYDAGETATIRFGRGGGASDGNISFATASVEKMRLTYEGNLGIGTASPSHKLQVQGNIYAAAGHIGLHRYGGNGGGSFYFAAFDNNHVVWNGFFGDSPDTQNNTNNFDGIYWRTYRGIRIKGGSIGAYDLIRAEGSNGTTNDHTVKLYAANVERLSTTTTGAYVNGNLGVGTTSPVSKLHVTGGSSNWNETTPGVTSGTIHLSPASTDNFGNALTFGASDASSGNNAQAGIYVRSNDTYGTKMYFATTDYYATGSKTRMFIGHNGNIGIGTTSPAQKLSVNGNIETIGIGRIGFNVADAYGSFPHYGLGFAGEATPVNLAGYYGLSFGTKGVERVRILENGNVGIGTTAPNYPFEVASTLGKYLFRSNAEAQDVGIYFSTPYTPANPPRAAIIGKALNNWNRIDLYFCSNNVIGSNPEVTTADVKMVVKANGNVLIGTTTDNGLAKLQVQGQVSADAYIAAGQQGLTIDIPTGAGQTLHFEGGILTSVT